MAASNAKASFQTIISLGSDVLANSPSYTEIPEVKTVTGLPAYTIDQIEVTHMQSTDGIREYVAGLKSPGTMSFEINWIPTNALHDYNSGLGALLLSGAKRAWKVYLTNFAVTFTFDGFVSKFEPQAPVDGAYTAAVEVQQSGTIAQS